MNIVPHVLKPATAIGRLYSIGMLPRPHNRHTHYEPTQSKVTEAKHLQPTPEDITRTDTRALRKAFTSRAHEPCASDAARNRQSTVITKKKRREEYRHVCQDSAHGDLSC